MTPADLRASIESALADLNRIGPDTLGDHIGRDELTAILDLIPPMTSEIVGALEAGDPEAWAERRDPVRGWRGVDVRDVDLWLGILVLYGDQPQPGYRIVRGDQ